MTDLSNQETQIVKEALGIPTKGTITPFDDEFPAENMVAEELTRKTASNADIHEPPDEPEPTGLSSADIDSLRELAQQYREGQAAQRFLQRHGPNSDLPFIPCEASGQLLFGYLADHNLPVTDTNLEIAFRDLNGLPTAVPAAPVTPAPAAPVQRRPISTGLPETNGPAIRPTDLDSPTDFSGLASELASMPLEQARTRMIRLMNLQRQRGR